MKRTVLEMLKAASNNYKNNIYVSDKTDDGWQGISFSQVDQMSSYLAIGFIKEGIHAYDKVAIMSEGRSAWIVAEYAVLKTRSVAVPLSVKLQPDEIVFRIKHSECKYIVVSKNCISKILEISDKLYEQGVKLVYLDKPDAEYNECKKRGIVCISYSDLVLFGRQHYSEYNIVLTDLMSHVSEDDVVTISYTSGTTGNPKGIMLTHLNYWSNSHDAVQYFRLENNLSTLVILPLDHSFAHTIGFYCAALCSITLYFVDARDGLRSQLKNLVPNIKEVQPDFLLSVPAITGNFMRKIQDTMADKGGFANWLFKTGLRNGIMYYGDGFRRPGLFARIFRYPIYKLADTIVFSKVRKVFGNNFKFFIGGGAMLDVKQQQFFNCIGAPVLQGYGLSEASPIVSVNQRDRHKFGSSGGVLSGIDCKIVDSEGRELPKGEKGFISLKGLNIMKGYFKNEKATAEVINSEGRLNSGDMGYFDKDGFLVVTGREKALLISADGEKYSPEEIEDAIVNCSEYILQCVLYNDHRKYTTAIVTIDEARLKSWIKDNNETSAENVLEIITNSFMKFTSDFNYKDVFPKQWIPNIFAIAAEPFSEKNGMVNSTMKIMRFKVLANYKERIEGMYTAEGKNLNRQENLKFIKSIMEK